MKSNKIIVGDLPTRKKLFGMMLFSAFLAVLFTNLLASLFHQDYLFWLIFIILFIAIVALYVPTFTGAYSFWSVDETTLQYTSIHRYGDELRCAIAILLGKEIDFAININITSIERIDVYWTSERCVWSTIAHPVKLGIQSRDGTLISFEALFSNTKQFLDAMDYLTSYHQIDVHDPDQIIETLKNPNVNFYEYLETLRGKRKGE